MNKKIEKVLTMVMVMITPFVCTIVWSMKNIFRGYVTNYASMLFFIAFLSAVTIPFLLIHQKNYEKFFMISLVGLLVITDQIIKFVMLLNDIDIEIIPYVFSLKISKNVFHTAMLSLFRLEIGIPGVVLIKAVSVFALLAGLRFIKKKFKMKEYIVWIFIMMLAGSIASFCDSIFWGYTLDYLYFHAYTVIDLKDIYLFVGVSLFNVTLLQECLYQKNVEVVEANKKEK